MQLGIGGRGQRFLPVGTLRPHETFATRSTLVAGDTTIELHHARGETDDHLWAFVPDRKWLFAGDFVIWHFPNAGNPQKVQRFPAEWAAALRTMAATGAELLVPAHGLPIEGAARIAAVLETTATALEHLVADVLAMMNAGASLDEVIHTVRVPDETLALPYLRPFYDEPEFVVHNVWRQYGGWWDGAASRPKPSPDRELAAAIAELSRRRSPRGRARPRGPRRWRPPARGHLADIADGRRRPTRASMRRGRRCTRRGLGPSRHSWPWASTAPRRRNRPRSAPPRHTLTATRRPPAWFRAHHRTTLRRMLGKVAAAAGVACVLGAVAAITMAATPNPPINGPAVATQRAVPVGAAGDIVSVSQTSFVTEALTAVNAAAAKRRSFGHESAVCRSGCSPSGAAARRCSRPRPATRSRCRPPCCRSASSAS